MIKKIGNQYALLNKAGTKVLGKHPTREKAVEQEQAIKASQGQKK